uniref:Uncharacterized protein n=1 Tax=Solibacter usitatus (strain Ellin6076) TaxID=234267 RepID=Q01S03_SOLUE
MYPTRKREKMRYMRFRLLGAALLFCLLATAQTTLTVDQLMKFLNSAIEMKQTDSEIAKYLAKTRLSDKLEDSAIEKLLAAGIGPKTLAVLHTLRDQSQALAKAKPAPPPPKVELPPVPSPEQQAAIVEDVREYALNYSKGLPNFLSTQVVRRYQAGAPGSRYGSRSSSEPGWQAMDTLTLRLSYFEQKEDYKLIMVNSAPTTQDYKKLGGATSTGEFGSLMRDIFEPATQARFEWDGWARLNGQLVMAFHYQVDQAHSQWAIDYEHTSHLVPAYSGRVLVDKDTHVVLRVTLNADDIPPSFPVKQATTILDYEYVDLSGHPFLLPLKSETIMSADGILSRNDTEFRLYRKYSAEAEIKYDITPDPLPEEKTKEVPAGAAKKVDCSDPKNKQDPSCKNPQK